MRLLVRADGWNAIGAGHVMRCLALAHAWRAQGGTVTFISFCDSDALAARLRAGCDHMVRLDHPHPSESDRVRLLEVAAQHPGSPVVLDGYGFDASYHRPLRMGGHPLLLLDDHVHQPSYDADWVLNQNALAKPELYRRLGSAAKLLLGPSFALIRGEFVAYHSWVRPPVEVARRVLVTLGGSDPGNVTQDVVRGAALASEPDWLVRIIVGHSNSNMASLMALVATQKLPFEISRAVDDMPAQMRWADLAISAAGSTIWELAYMQVPALLIKTADNQGTNSKDLDTKGVARDLGCPDGDLVERVGRGLRELSPDGARRAEMARAGRALVDGLGARRVIEVIAAGASQA